MKRYLHTYMAVCLFLGFLTACIEDDKISVDEVRNASEPELSDVRRIGKTATTITLAGEVTKTNGYPVI